MLIFDPQNASGLVDLLQKHECFLKERLLQPVLAQLDSYLPSIKLDLANLRNRFLGSPLQEPPEVNIHAQFSTESKHKDVGAQVRRYFLGTQAKGLHANMRAATTCEEHLAFAQECPHPAFSSLAALQHRGKGL